MKRKVDIYRSHCYHAAGIAFAMWYFGNCDVDETEVLFDGKGTAATSINYRVPFSTKRTAASDNEYALVAQILSDAAGYAAEGRSLRFDLFENGELEGTAAAQRIDDLLAATGKTDVEKVRLRQYAIDLAVALIDSEKGWRAITLLAGLLSLDGYVERFDAQAIFEDVYAVDHEPWRGEWNSAWPVAPEQIRGGYLPPKWETLSEPVRTAWIERFKTAA